jgi:hypothetical protein
MMPEASIYEEEGRLYQQAIDGSSSPLDSKDYQNGLKPRQAKLEFGTLSLHGVPLNDTV